MLDGGVYKVDELHFELESAALLELEVRVVYLFVKVIYFLGQVDRPTTVIHLRFYECMNRADN